VLARFRRTLPAVAGELRALREGLQEWLSIHTLTPVAPALVLAVGEACANAIEHAYADGPHGPIEVAIDQHEGDILSVTVRDFGRWRSAPEIEDPASLRGRGIGIMRSLTTDFQRESGDHGTTVRFQLAARKL
jgi:anti-sigma regulatory factor (Ser/Thr protein kinase)